jgi:D-glycero-D-manno-heptose 1,7-bisphosphate phosphatase
MIGSKQAVFCDRDGVIVRDVEYLSDPAKIEILEGVPRAVSLLKEHSFLVVVVTNQSGVARGFFPEHAVHQINKTINMLLSVQGASIDSFYYCPHHAQGVIAQYRLECECRKPKPGMLLRAAGELGIDLRRSLMVGDKISDIAAGKSAGTRSVLIDAGVHATLLNDEVGADWIGSNLLEAAQWIVSQTHQNRPIRTRGELVDQSQSEARTTRLIVSAKAIVVQHREGEV